MASYAGGRDIFRAHNADIPPPGTYDVHSPENPYKKYGFLNHGERFRPDRVDDRPEYTRSNSRTSYNPSQGQRRTAGSTMTAIRAEETRLKREIEHQQRIIQELQVEGTREVRMLSEKIKQAEQRIKDVQRERNEVRQRLIKSENELRAKEKECEMLEKQQQQQHLVANPKAEKALRDHSQAADAMAAKLKSTVEKMRQMSEEDRRKVRQLEHQVRKLEQQKEMVESELKNVEEADYPHRLKQAEKELRQREEQWREDMRKLTVSLQEARDSATGYMNELAEATVHATALESELHVARERERSAATASQKQLDSAMEKLTATQNRLSDLERMAKQRSEESERMLRAATGHVDELKNEVARLEEEREKMLSELNGEIQALTRDYRNAQRDFATSVKGADDERSRRLAEAQKRVERANKEAIELKAEISELRGILLKKEMAWRDKHIELEGYLQTAADDFQSLQEQAASKQEQLEGRLQTLEEQIRANESAWASERTGLLEKLDGAHKDGFRLRDALDTMQKEAAQVKADCEADLLRMGHELDDLRAELDQRETQWADERRELQRSHMESVAELKEEAALLEQQRHDDRTELERQLQEALAEIDALKKSHEEELCERDEQLVEAEAELQNMAQISRELELQIMDRDAEHNERVAGLESAAEEKMQRIQDELLQTRQELQAAQEHIDRGDERLESERHEAEGLRQENDALVARLQELEEINEEIKLDCQELERIAEEISEDLADSNDLRDRALAHYAGMMQAMADKHSAERDAWKAERSALRGRIERYQYREAMFDTELQYMSDMLEIKEAARQHMVQEARSLYCELQDQAAVADDHMDAGAELASDLQRLLTIDGRTSVASADGIEIGQVVDEMRVWTRHAFLDDMQRLTEAQVTSIRLEADVQELRYMRMQGEIVETVGDMSSQHKRERARLESSLQEASADFRQLQQQASEYRADMEARVRELEEALQDMEENGAGHLGTDQPELTQYIAKLEARVEALGYEINEERAQQERLRDSHDRQVYRLHQVLDQKEADAASSKDDMHRLRNQLLELEGEQAVMAEKLQFQNNWLKENHAMAFRDLESMLNNNGGHTNLRQRIRYVESLKTQIVALKKENFECSRERDRFKHHVGLLRSELDAYKEVKDVDALRAANRRVRGQPVSRQAKNGAVAGGGGAKEQ
ncbi:hypothetical protein GGI07_001925 [Coemansia sp. Benny D115]|nr:hypothetical protein GGI07_001925 [Coemansia sp. Benny D115]